MTEVVLLPVAWTKGIEFRRAAAPGASDHLFDRFGTTSSTVPVRPCASRTGLADRRDRHRRPSGRGVVARRRCERADPVLEESIGAEWQTDERRVGAVFIGRNRHAGRRVGAGVHRRRLRRTVRLRLAHLRSRQPGRTVAVRSRTGRRPHPAAVQLRHGTWPVGHHDGDHRQPGKEARVLRRRLNEVQANMQRTVEGIKQLAEASP